MVGEKVPATPHPELHEDSDEEVISSFTSSADPMAGSGLPRR